MKLPWAMNRKLQDRSGSVAVIFAGALVVMALIVSGAIEYHRRNQAMAILQNAVDAATLTTKRQEVLAKKSMTLAMARAKGETAGRAAFQNIIDKSSYFKKSTPAVSFSWDASDGVAASATTTFDMFFGNLLPTNFSNVVANAQVQIQNSIPTEVALVLDNTMSMFNKDARPETRFTLMRNAAKSFTHSLFNAAQSANDVNLVRISVVPWATSVNVLGGAPGAADFSGDAPVSTIPDYGSQVAVSMPLNRSGTVSWNTADFVPVKWRGCVSGLGETMTYDDSSVTSFKALNIPPHPGYLVNLAEGPSVATSETNCTCVNSVVVPCSSTPTTQGFNRLLEKSVPQIGNAALFLDRTLGKQGKPDIEQAQCTSCVTQSCVTTTVSKPACGSSPKFLIPYCNWYTNYGRDNSYHPVNFACTNTWDSCYDYGARPPMPDKTQNACVGDPNEPGIANGSVAWCPNLYWPDAKLWNAAKPITGPNLNCPMPMLGLSGNRKQVIEYIDRLSPVPGGTHADVGLRWGLRSLSPNGTWPGFFGLTKKPGTFGPESQKVLVLITDGENEQAGDFPGYWGCSRVDPANSPGCSGSPNQAELDARMLGWCDAIRTKYQVTIYAVAVNFANTAAVNKLKTCAGNPANVFSVDAADLTNVLDGIASRVMALRLTQ